MRQDNYVSRVLGLLRDDFVNPAPAGSLGDGAGVLAPRVVVAGGHSAGHIEPTMNVADALHRLEPTAEITALGTVRGVDSTLIPARGCPLELIPPVPLPRKLNRAPCCRRRAGCATRERAAGAVLDRVRAEGRGGLRRLRGRAGWKTAGASR